MRKLLPIIPFFLLTGCATAGDGEALKQTFDSGVAAYDAGDYAKAYKIWSGIEDYDLAAMRNVAMMLRKGQGVARNPQKAEDIYETAADAGLPTAQADLADMLLKGEAGPPDPQRALPLLEAAAAANHPIAQFQLGQMYEAGELVPKNPLVARRLYAAAASHGMTQAQARLDAMGPAPKDEAPAGDGGTLRLMQPAPAAAPPPAATSASNAPLRTGEP